MVCVKTSQLLSIEKVRELMTDACKARARAYQVKPQSGPNVYITVAADTWDECDNQVRKSFPEYHEQLLVPTILYQDKS